MPRDFLAQADNIWKAARYLDPQPSAFSSIPSLMIQRGGQEVEVDDGKEKAAILISNAFSPVQPGWKEEYATAVNINSEDPDITVVEVKTAPTKTSPFKAPGIDGIPSYSFTVFSVVSAAPDTNMGQSRPPTSPTAIEAPRGRTLKRRAHDLDDQRTVKRAKGNVNDIDTNESRSSTTTSTNTLISSMSSMSDPDPLTNRPILELYPPSETLRRGASSNSAQSTSTRSPARRTLAQLEHATPRVRIMQPRQPQDSEASASLLSSTTDHPRPIFPKRCHWHRVLSRNIQLTFLAPEAAVVD
ncbi:hypothetical protein BDV97DRAFT_399728 [Delphinella strobiligena]|nr:hypothetical protein BDV97DRAFT_399728 [Delphinella strobiligena]